jgi:tRNA uridine 5-carbamoylmethylation protein Kti12
MLVGIPGSGKTTFSKLLMTVNKQDNKQHFIRASLDEDKKDLFE